MKDGSPGMKDTLLSFPRRGRWPIELLPTSPPPATRIRRHCYSRVVILRFRFRSGRLGSGRSSLWRACRFSQRQRARSHRHTCRPILGGRRLRLRCCGRVVDGRVLARRAWRDGEELVERQDARLAAHPSCGAFSVGPRWIEGKLRGARTPFWPSWNCGGPGW